MNRLVSTLLLFSFMCAGVPARAQSRFTVDDMLKIKRIADPQVSPDGRYVAYVVTEVDQQANTRNNDIWIAPVVGGEPVRFLGSDNSEDHPRWSPDGRQLAFVSSRDHDGSQVYLVAAPSSDNLAAAGDPKKLTSLATEASGPIWSPDGKWIAFVSQVFADCDTLDCNVQKLKAREQSKTKARLLEGLMFRHWVAWKDGLSSHLFLVPVDGSAPPRDLTAGSASDVPPFSLGGPLDYEFSPDSKEIAYVKKTDAVEATSTNSDLFIVPVSGVGDARKLTPNSAADGGPAYSPDGRYLAYRAQSRAGAESDRWQLMVLDRTTGNARSLTREFDRSPDEYVWTPDSQGLIFVAGDRGRSPIYHVGLDGKEPRALVTDGSNQELQLTRDGRTVVFTRSSLHAPAEIFRAPAAGGAASAITTTNDRLLAPFKLRPAESVTYQGAGGTPIQAWIVKPSDFQEGRRYPLLYLVHGGPQSAWGDAWSYRWNAQVFANAGYVAFMPNPRGSTTFGQQFTDEISGDWGGKVYEDLMKGADYAEGLPYVDRSRTGAAGASYGGYMMNWFLGHTDRFKALVSHAGVFNLTSMYGVTEELWFPEWDLKGTPWTNPEMYERWSPHRFAKNFKTPTLVTHGDLDFRVPIGEGFQLYTTLQRLGVPSKMLYLPDEGHWIGKPQNSALWYRTFLDWMNRWVKGEAGTASRN